MLSYFACSSFFFFFFLFCMFVCPSMVVYINRFFLLASKLKRRNFIQISKTCTTSQIKQLNKISRQKDINLCVI